MTQLIVRLARPNGHPVETLVFARSPISVGSAPNSLIRLNDPTISPCQAVIDFTATAIRYMCARRTIVIARIGPS
jgi:hypothetical protein